MTDKPGEILCTAVNDSRLIAAGAAALSAHAARRAGLSREAQEEIGDAAIEVCSKAFQSAATPRKTPRSIHVDISDLPDRVDVTLDARDTQTQATHAQVHPPLDPALAEQVRCEVGDGYFHISILKSSGAPNGRRGAGDAPAGS